MQTTKRLSKNTIVLIFAIWFLIFRIYFSIVSQAFSVNMKGVNLEGAGEGYTYFLASGR